MSFYRPTGRLAPNLAALAYASVALAALEYQARRGEIILLYADETILWRFALPRLGWWRRTSRARLPTRPLSRSQIKREEALKRHTWGRSRSWGRITSGVLLNVIGAVQYGTAKVFYKIVPHFDAEGFRQYIHQVMGTFGLPGKRSSWSSTAVGSTGQKACLDLGPLARAVSVTFFTGAVWTPSQSH